MAILKRLKLMLLCLTLGLALAVGLTSLPESAQAQRVRLPSFVRFPPVAKYFFTIKYGQQDAAGNSDNLVDDFAAEHGALQGDRVADTIGAELDVVQFPNPTFGAGFGLELHFYNKNMTFADQAQLELKGKAILYNLKLYARAGIVLAYFGLGSGNYFVKYTESTASGVVSFRDTSRNVFTTRAGLRLLLGGVSLLLEYGRNRAPVIIETRPNRPVLDLGGEFQTLGLALNF
ncbi:MAG: hypothetical protein O7A08_08195 [SAR324 cluster bacterium]|nr:hypothetical protein [SAR324 cluster bacterium]MCZ6532930.1 hypothetical protein [SAR324 cluster bacterium]MCZ6626825.1 hypothetical protein [SAR324 cluster bacterium]MCZ6645734.1 hypothetical protein [SAR324 cluster bacterium]MCZ6729721.1 hypothetical protein [SAR324 cluster bacterium]